MLWRTQVLKVILWMSIMLMVYVSNGEAAINSPKMILKCSAQAAIYSHEYCQRHGNVPGCYYIPYIGIRSCFDLCEGKEEHSTDETRCHDSQYCKEFAQQYCQLQPQFLPTSTPLETTTEWTKSQPNQASSTNEPAPKPTDILKPQAPAVEGTAIPVWGIALLVIACSGIAITVVSVSITGVIKQGRSQKQVQQDIELQEMGGQRANLQEEPHPEEPAAPSQPFISQQETGLQGICQDPPGSERPID